MIYYTCITLFRQEISIRHLSLFVSYQCSVINWLPRLLNVKPTNYCWGPYGTVFGRFALWQFNHHRFTKWRGSNWFISLSCIYISQCLMSVWTFMPLDPTNHLVFLCVYLVLYNTMMMHVIHNSISITQYVMERIKTHSLFCSICFTV